mmetsp:Transcript_4477/g.4202  ORF Transcript_4477/g.4202 Transcript_4477/m.4202 type:complete len:119 (-) Transcript_4477:24-380(-)
MFCDGWHDLGERDEARHYDYIDEAKLGGSYIDSGSVHKVADRASTGPFHISLQEKLIVEHVRPARTQLKALGLVGNVSHMKSDLNAELFVCGCLVEVVCHESGLELCLVIEVLGHVCL